MRTHESPSKNAATTTTGLAERAASTADEALVTTQRAASTAASAVDSTLENLRETVPPAIAHAAMQAESVTRRGIDKARDATTAVRDRCIRAGDQTVGYIREEPVKAMLVAVAAGAVAAVLLGWVNRSGSSRL